MSILTAKQKENEIYIGKTFTNKHKQVQDNVGGVKLKHLENNTLSLPFWEKKYYEKNIKKHLKGIDRDAKVLDVGCGDGRFTEMLLDIGFCNIYSLDSNIHSLRRLKNSLKSKGKLGNVKIIYGDVLDMPFRSNSFDIVLSIGVLYYLNENYESGLSEIARCMSDKSKLLETEPDKIGNAIKAIIFDGIERFLKVSHENRFLEYFSGEPVELRCFSDSEIKNIHDTVGLNVTACESIPLMPSLLVIGSKRNIIDEQKIKNRVGSIKKAFNKYGSESAPSKHKLWISKSVDN
jgi:ubiquinone/menaquinone biosynthesis C-methylase UbiE